MRRHVLIVPLGLLLLLLAGAHAVSGGGAEAGAAPYVREDASRITLGNDHVEIGFDKASRGGIASLVNKRAGLEFRTNPKSPPLLFRVVTTKKKRFNNWDNAAFRHESGAAPDGSRTVKLISENRDTSMRVVASVTAHPGDPLLDFALTVENTGSLALVELQYPIFAGNKGLDETPGDDVLVYPGWGTSRLVEDPMHTWDHPCDFTAKECTGGVGARNIYPGWASTQMMAFYEPKGGFYVATHDDKIHTKAFVAGIWEDRNVLLSIRHLLPIRRGQGWSSPYPIKAGAFQGDWYDAADIYKAWARNQWWARKTVADKGTPAWFLDAPGFLQFYNYNTWATAQKIENVIYKIPDIARRTNELSKQWNVPLCDLILGWPAVEKNLPNPKKHNLVPPYRSPWEGEETFRQAMDTMREQGNRGLIYIGASLYGGVKRRDPVLQYALKNPRGKPFWGWGVKTPYMDPTTDFWRTTVRDTTLKVLDLGVDMVQMDTWPVAFPDYRPSDRHPMGFGPWIGKAWFELVKDVRIAAKKKNPEVVISSEEICEVYLPLLDAYVSRDNAPDFNYQTKIPQEKAGKWKTIPLFAYVYGPYITSFGQAVLSRYGLARALVRGKLPMLAGNNRDASVSAYYGKVARATHTYAREYVLYGEMLRPQELSAPEVSVRGSFFANTAVQADTSFRTRALFHSVWTHGGKVAYFFTNISDAPVAASVQLEPYGLRHAAYRVSEIRDGTRKTLLSKTPLPKPWPLTVGGGEVVVLEIERAP